MIPPGFIRYYDEKGLHKPYCFECVHFATEKGTTRGLCWEYGAYVSLYSTCGTFERRAGSSTPILDKSEIAMSHRFGLSDLVK